MRPARHCWSRILLGLTLAVCSARISAQQQLHTRVFRFRAEPPSVISVGPRGTVWVRHADTTRISALDGYGVRELNSIEGGSFRVVESRSGQLWSCYSQGLVLYDRNQWSRHPLAPIANELQFNPLRQLRQISLVPAEVNRVLFLLGDALYEFDAFEGGLRVLARSSEIGLGRFSEMQETRDGSLLIAAERGLIRSVGPLRQISPAARWDTLPFPPNSQIENVQRPFEDFDGGLFVLGALPGSTADRVIAHYQNGAWSFRTVLNERLKQAWPSWDSTLWAYSFNSLIQLGSSANLGNTAIQREAIVGGQFDVAVETNGVFWIATSEGLTRYGPMIWQTPPLLRTFNNPVHALLFESTNSHWAAATEGLYRFTAGGLELNAWPENIEAFATAPREIIPLPNGALAICSRNRTLLFNRADRSFHLLQHPSAATLAFAGKVGGLPVFKISPPATPAASTFESFDGASFQPLPHRIDYPQLGFNPDFIAETRAGDLWLIGGNGAGVYNKLQQRFELMAADVLSDVGSIFTMLELPDGRVWFASPDRVIEFEGKTWRTVFPTNERVLALHRSRTGKIHIATAAGLYRLERGAFVLNDTDQGLPSPVVYSLAEDLDGRLWAGTARGFSRFAPEADNDPPRTATPTVRESSAQTAEAGTLVHFTATDRWSVTPPASLLFSWRVDEGAWTPYTNAASAFLQGLRPGPHRFDVRSMDLNGNEDPSPSAVEFGVILPWHDDPRLVGVSIFGAAVILGLAALAVNRHLRLLRSYAEVERIVAERTRQLEKANEELLHSQKMRALGTLASGIAHDFNNILSIIKGSAQIIEANPNDTEKVQTRLNRIKMMVDQGSGIVRSMLGLGRLSEREMQRANPVKLVEDTVKALSEKIPAHVMVVVDQHSVASDILCHRDLLQQILINLILNAVDAITDSGKIRLRITESASHDALTLLPAPGERYVSIFVEDTGHGISEEALPRIFEPFFTTKAMSARRGTGLGLSMVYELAKGMGYGIGVSSTPGRGTVFQIVIPQSEVLPMQGPRAKADVVAKAPV
ncbi:MAG TPA: ATP-binding protein [Methylomirabilota bacterium]|nr:ATP-binding protein [Methylomirabilota bacterium]